MEKALFDSHAHVLEPEGESGYRAVLTRAFANGVGCVLAVGGTDAMNAGALAAAAEFPGRVRAAIGWDRELAPTLAGDDHALQAALAQLCAMAARHRDVVGAVGETGLDYHYQPETAAEQRRLFTAQLIFATSCQLPLVVHSREADADTLALIREHVRPRESSRSPGVLHCFTGGLEFARCLLELGFSISFSGIVTFANANALREVARHIPDDRLLIETDSPYLAPVPLRGQRNEPAHVRHVAAVLAQVRGTTAEAIARITAENGRRLFGFPVSSPAA